MDARGIFTLVQKTLHFSSQYAMEIRKKESKPMKKKRSLGILLLVGGVALILFSMYISGQVTEGREKISNAQNQVDRGKKLFSLTPYTEPLGKGLTGAAQRKIDEGRQEADEYAQLADWLKIGGVVCIIAGGAVFLMSRKRRS